MRSAASIAVTNPQRTRADLRQANNRQREQTPERKAAVEKWCIGKLCSCGCGQPANCAHHPTDDLYGDQWGNLDECEPYNGGCHKMRHRGYDRCPECGGWMRRGSEKCAKCRGWRAFKRPKKDPHPCDRHSEQSVNCLWPGYGACDQNRKNASKNKCGHYKVRKAAVS